MLRYYNELNAGDEWLLMTEYENTRSFSPDRQREILARTTLARPVSKMLNIGLGIGFNGVVDTEADMWQPEWRSHQQVVLGLERNRFNFAQRLRVEQLFGRPVENEKLQQGYSFTPRTRYFLQVSYDLRKESGRRGNVAAHLWNEVYVYPFGENVFFTENQLNTGVLYQLSDAISIVLSHSWLILQNEPAVFQYGSIFRLVINQHLVLE
ncbi:DUF2490 domain-containing protein [Pontibacter diazotrophicus]|uniref:DUF2490 domain-containing protein n=1 Tax=Pontibacter diazotrophicus TaxID=1400979 RepID=UPI0015F18335|nr:DUF2490 domain-containing protein [Pontibacter diazotrophicus]